MATAKRKQMTQRDFDAIKALLAAGLKTSKIVSILQRGSGTIWYVSQSATFEDYQKMTKRVNKKQAQEQLSALPKENNNEFLNHRMVETISLHLHKLYPLLERIAVALEEANKLHTINTIGKTEDEKVDQDDKEDIDELLA